MYSRQGHKGYWESPKTDWGALGIDQAFADSNVDMYFTGHTHNYQCTSAFQNEAASDDKCFVYLNCKGTIAGSPGMDQGLGTRNAPADILQIALQAWGMDI